MLRRFLGLGAEGRTRSAADPAESPSVAASAEETETVRRIVQRLDAMPQEHARFVACFAYILSRAANADLAVSDDETRLMGKLLVEFGGLDEGQAVLVVEIAKLQSQLYGATEDYLVTREFARLATDEQRLALLRSCFLVAATDQTITADEASVVNEIARELGVDRPTLNAVREEFVDNLSVIQRLRREGQACGEFACCRAVRGNTSSWPRNVESTSRFSHMGSRFTGLSSATACAVNCPTSPC